MHPRKRLDNSVIIIKSGQTKSNNNSLEKKPLSMMMFDPKLKEGKKDDLFVPKAEFPFKVGPGNTPN